MEKVRSSRVALAAAFLFALNAVIVRELFHVEYTRHWFSIEAAYISISQYILDHGRDFSWFPLWYGGIPFQNSYPPLLHILVATDASLFHISAAQAHHAVSGFFYCLGPVALFLLVYAMSNRFALSLTAALIFSFTSPSALFLRQVAGDMESIRSARRLQALISYGEGPHVTSITLLLLAILALHLALERVTPIRLAFAILAFASVVLTNWLGAFALALATVSYLFARSALDRRYLRMLSVTAAIGLIAYCLIAPWIPPSTLRAVQRNAQFVIGQYQMGARQWTAWLLVLALCAVLFWLLRKSQLPLVLQFASYFLLLTAALVIPADRFHFYLMPQPDRYHLEFEIALAIVAAFAIDAVSKRRIWLIVLLLIAGAIQVRTYRRYARSTLRPADVHQAVEYQVANWLQNNLPDQRVFATGSVQFWLNAFAHNPQVGGGYGQGVINPEIPILHYGIPYTTGDGERTAMWLRLLGAQAVVTSGPSGRDAFKEAWRDPHKFDGVLPELWRDGDDAIYRVSQRTTSFAHVIERSDVVERSPVNVADVEPVRKLAAALDDSSLPLASFQWLHPGLAHITGVLKQDQLLFVQLSYHPGWKASVNGEQRAMFQDGLGFLVIEPRCNGPCDVQLAFDGGAEMRRAYLLRILGILAGFVFLSWAAWPRRTAS